MVKTYTLSSFISLAVAVGMFACGSDTQKSYRVSASEKSGASQPEPGPTGETIITDPSDECGIKPALAEGTSDSTTTDICAPVPPTDPSATPDPYATPTANPSASPTASPIPTDTPTPTPTVAPTPSPTPTYTPPSKDPTQNEDPSKDPTQNDDPSKDPTQN